MATDLNKHPSTTSSLLDHVFIDANGLIIWDIIGSSVIDANGLID
jgi:hypothetical protein